MAIPEIDALTPELTSQLVDGSKIRFKWHGNSFDYYGRIVKDYLGLHYVPECYYHDEDKHLFESMKYYNPLSSFSPFIEFEIL